MNRGWSHHFIGYAVHLGRLIDNKTGHLLRLGLGYDLVLISDL